MPEQSFAIVPLQAAGPRVDLFVRQELCDLAPYLRLVFSAMGASCVVTVGKEGQHSERSRHDEGACLDLRIWGLLFGDYGVSTKAWWRCLVRWCSHLATALVALVGPYVFIVLEKNHIHLEWAGPGERPNILGLVPGKHFYMTKDVRELIA